MVTNVSNFGRNGVYDWIIQRLSAVVLAAYAVFLLVYLFSNPDLTYGEWQGLFASTGMRFFSMLALLSLCAHAWIGMWTISTDYLTHSLLGAKGTVLRVLFQVFCVLLILFYLFWGIQIFWGV